MNMIMFHLLISLLFITTSSKAQDAIWSPFNNVPRDAAIVHLEADVPEEPADSDEYGYTMSDKPQVLEPQSSPLKAGVLQEAAEPDYKQSTDQRDRLSPNLRTNQATKRARKEELQPRSIGSTALEVMTNLMSGHLIRAKLKAAKLGYQVMQSRLKSIFNRGGDDDDKEDDDY